MAPRKREVHATTMDDYLGAFESERDAIEYVAVMHSRAPSTVRRRLEREKSGALVGLVIGETRGHTIFIGSMESLKEGGWPQPPADITG